MRDEQNKKIPLLALVGPTGVGKTELALNVARLLKTDIISADSALVYRMMDIGTAKPTLEQQKVVKHHLIDLVDPDCCFSVADYQKAANRIIRQLWNDGKLPFIVGGTGLYIKAVVENYVFGEKGGDPKLRQFYEGKADRNGLASLYEQLKKYDPDAAYKIHPNDKRRIIRALEVFAMEGRPISSQVEATGKTESPYCATVIGLNMKREELYRRINERVDIMLQHGFLEEVQKIIKTGYKRSDPGMQVLGYRQLYAYLKGEFNWTETVTEIKQQTRNLAKRQLTWFRADQSVHWYTINSLTSYDNLSENIYLKVQDLTP